MSSKIRPFDFLRGCRCGAVECATHEAIDVPSDRIELPRTIEPLSYTLDLRVRLHERAFDGAVEIEIDVKQDGLTSCTLHARELAFESAYCAGLSATEIAIDADASTATLTFGGHVLPIGRQRLQIKYTGVLNDQMDGFYLSAYTDGAGIERTFASTFFCATTARKCLPCWDEPRRKATFTCSLRVPVGLTALSNMPERCEPKDHGDGTKTCAFAPTPRMSTYLLCFVVGEVEALEGRSSRGVLCRVLTPPGKRTLGAWALEHCVLALDQYETLFGVEYPLPKMDLVALPEFSMGAMENWGLVTYREARLLLTADASPAQRQAVAETVIHEVAHQWFGNLVTMEWWEDIWLNEGFATWMENFVCDAAHPDWDKDAQFVSRCQGGALERDALRSSHPIQMPMARAEQVDELFDAISYLKGASVIRMLYAVVGDAGFFAGLRAYMASFKYGNATTADLWAQLEAASGREVRQIAADWTRQMGFPLLDVTSVESIAAVASEPPAARVRLTQSWFLADGSPSDESERKLWTVPVFATGAARPHSQRTALHIMSRAESDELHLDSCDGRWVKLNAGQCVPLRVRYPDAMVPALAEAMRTRELGTADRIGLLSDYAVLCRARLIRPARLLELLHACRTEDEPVVLCEALDRLAALHGLLSSAPPALREPFGAFARSILMPQAARLGWEPQKSDGHLTRKLRGVVIGLLPQFCADDATVIAEARSRFNEFIADPAAGSLPAELQATVFEIVLHAGGAAEFDSLLHLYRTLPLAVERNRALAALGAAPTEALRGRALALLLTPEVKAQDIALVPATMHAGSAEGRAHTWAFFKASHVALNERAGGGLSNLLDSLIGSCCARFCTTEEVADVRAFFESHPFKKNARKISTLLETMATNEAYLMHLASEDSGMLAWLQTHA